MWRITDNLKIILYSVLHFFVDGMCAFVVFSSVYNYQNYDQVVLVFLLYNILAFMFQPFLGLLIDKYDYEKVYILIVGGILILNLWIKLPDIITVILIGVSNSLFHVVGGKYTLKTKPDSGFFQGLFVSLGAIGLSLGTYYYGLPLKIVLSIGSILILLLILFGKEAIPLVNKDKEKKSITSKIWIIILLCIVVFLRAFVNKEIHFTWADNRNKLLLIAIMTALGKIVGGIFLDKTSITFTMVLSTIVSILCLCISYDYSLLNLVGIFAFNFSMPITLYLINKAYPKHEGFTFGLLAFMLFPGYLLGMIDMNTLLSKILLGLSCLISLGLILLSLLKMKKDEKR